MAGHSLNTTDLVTVIGDNDGVPPHRAGYNGVWSLQHRLADRSLFVPAYAGLNFEHIVSGEFEDQNDIFFEPRRAPMSSRRIDDNRVELYQAPTPTFHLESWTTFRSGEPDHLDMEFRCRATQHVFAFDYIACFWASYINAPLDKSLYFSGGLEGQRDIWSQFCTQQHDLHSTLRGRDDDFEMQFADNSREALYKNFSPMRFDLPLFYGRFDDLIFVVMLDSGDGFVRLTHSPSGGGVNTERKTANPAWDFQFIVPDYEINTDYRLRTRTILRPANELDRVGVLAEYHAWKTSLDE